MSHVGIFEGRAERRVVQKRYEWSHVIVRFDHEVSIVEESAISCGDEAEGRAIEVMQVPILRWDFMRLLEHSTVAPFGDANGTLSLRFDNGETFKCYESLANFECYRIICGQQSTIV